MLNKSEIINLKRHNIEIKNGVYFLIHNGEIVYIGKSQNIFMRVASHKEKAEKHFDGFSYLEIDKGSDLLKIENIYIAKYKPKYNIFVKSEYSLGSKSPNAAMDEIRKKAP